MKYKIILLYFILIIKLLYCFGCITKDTILECGTNIKSCQFMVTDNVNRDINIETKEFQLESNGTLDLMNLKDGSIFIESYDACQVYSNPIIKSMDIAPVSGGPVNFSGAFLVNIFGKAKKMSIGNSKFDFIYDPSSRNYTFNCPPGCGAFNITYEDTLFYTGIYKKPILNSSAINIENKVDINYLGLHLASPSITINGTNYQKSTVIENTLYSSFDNVTFRINEIKYCGKWLIKFYSCGIELNSIQIHNEPKIYGLNSVSSSDGGNVTINGINLYSRSLDINKSDYSGYNITVFTHDAKYLMNCQVIDYNFTNDSIVCFMPPTTGIKRNLKLILKIDNQFKTSTNFSYNSPSISSVNQITFPSKGLAEFKINGKYLNDKLISMVLVKVPSNQSSIHHSIIMDQKCQIVNKTESEMIVQVPLNAYPGYIVVVTNDGFDQVNSNIGDLKFKPILYGVTNSNTIGEKVVINGVSVHTQRIVDGNKFENLSVNIQAQDQGVPIKCNNPISYDGIHIECRMESGVGCNLPYHVKIEQYTGVLSFCFKAPIIADVKLTRQNTSSNITTLPGENLGDQINKVSISAGKLELKVVKANHTVLEFIIPNELNDINNLTIKIGSNDHQNVINYEFVVKPIIHRITSTPLKGGIVTITGRHLSSLANIAFRAPRNKPSTIRCINPRVSQDRSRLYCEVIGVSSASLHENGAGEAKLTSGFNLTIHMTLKGRECKNENNITFSFEPPVIYESSGKIGLDMGLITISGDNFNKKKLNVWIGDRVCKYPNVESGFNTITCRLDKVKNEDRTYYESKKFDIIVEVDGQKSILKNNFTYYFKEPIIHKEANKIIWLAPAITICGLICLITILSIIIHKYQRYRRLKMIQKILNKPIINNDIEQPYQQQNNNNNNNNRNKTK